jgi:voltage-gated potassium channel
MIVPPMTMDAHSRKRRLGWRLAHRRASQTFGTVLVLIGMSFVFAASAPDSAWSASVLVLLESLTLIAALWTSGVARADSPLSVGLLALAVASATISLVVGGSTLLGIVATLSGALSIGVIVVLARAVAQKREVNAQSVLGAICVYVMLGIVFMFLYGAVASIDSANFFAQGTDGTRALRLYFSYVTLATLGYGDYTPATNLGHMLAISEALIGQLYLVTVVAVLVTRMRVRQDVADAQAGGPDTALPAGSPSAAEAAPSGSSTS